MNTVVLIVGSGDPQGSLRGFQGSLRGFQGSPATFICNGWESTVAN